MYTCISLLYIQSDPSEGLGGDFMYKGLIQFNARILSRGKPLFIKHLFLFALMKSPEFGIPFAFNDNNFVEEVL